MNSHEKIEQHLIKQKRRAGTVEADGEFHCKYRTPAGDKCAAGCLIPDEAYKEEFEGRAARYLAKDVEVFPADIKPSQVADWQLYHDTTLYTEYGIFCYQKWVEGNEAHHPTLAAIAIQRVADEAAKAKALSNTSGNIGAVMQSNLCQEIALPVS